MRAADPDIPRRRWKRTVLSRGITFVGTAGIASVVLGLFGCYDLGPMDTRNAKEPAASKPAVFHETAEIIMNRPLGSGKIVPELAETARDAILDYAPYKQVNLAPLRPDVSIGRTPAAACDAALFLLEWLHYRPDDAAARRKLDELIGWVIGHQRDATDRIGIPGVASMPDAASPRDGFYYAIDAAICGTAMIAVFDVMQRSDAFHSATGFGEFLLNLGAEHHHRSTRAAIGATAFCEYITRSGRGFAYNCDAYVKNALALGFLSRLSGLSGDPRYAEAAARARDFFVAGLRGAWEYAEAPKFCGTSVCLPIWRRVQGSRGEPDIFVYGDTLAYGLRGLFDYEGASAEVLGLYRRLTSFRGRDPRTKAFDSRIAMAGYMLPDRWAPDPESAYYDLVTIGILQPVRRAAAPEDFRRAAEFLAEIHPVGVALPWGVGFEGQAVGIGSLDLTTVSVLGKAVIDYRKAKSAMMP